MPGVSRNTAFKRKWTYENMTEAVKAVQANKLSFREAAKKYSVPKSTLRDRVLGRYKIESRPGPQTVLSPTEEDDLVTWILEMASIGYGVTRDKVIQAVKSTLDMENRTVRFTDNRPGKDWWYAFLRRHPQLTSSGALEMSRSKVCSRETLDMWFNGFKDFLREHNITDSSQVYSCDRTSFLFDASSLVIDIGELPWQSYEVISKSKGSLTTLVCICAGGSILPPFHVYPGIFDAEVMANSVPEAHFAFTQDGSISTSQFSDWLSNRFIKQIPPQRPVVLLLNNHPSHFDFTMRQFCRDNQILLYCLPPNSSEVAQPLRTGFFESLKDRYYEEVCRHNYSHPDDYVSTKLFAGIFRAAWLDISIGTIISCFRDSGIWPVDRLAITDEKLQPSNILG